MARRTGLEVLLDALARLPWWLLLGLAPISYQGIRYGLPLIETDDPVLAALLPGVAALAWVPALLLVTAAVIGVARSLSRRRLFDRQTGTASIGALSWQSFERLVGEAYRRQGFAVTETGQSGPDGGVDLVLRRDGETVLVQCKRWRTRSIGVATVRELLGAVTAASATRGIVVGSGTFTKAAAEFARANRIELVDGEALTRLVSGVPGAPARPGSAAPAGSKQPTRGASGTFACPICHAPMVARLARRGRRSGRTFLGCSRYPKCRGTRELA